MNTKKTTAFIVGAMLIATVLVVAVSAAGMPRSSYIDMPRMVYEFDAADDTGIYINNDGLGNATVRIYGEEDAIYPTQSYTEANDFIYPSPVDAFDPGVIGKDSVTFNPAYMDDAATIDGGLTWDDMKVFFRIFYEPEYGHVVDELMDTTPPGDSQVKPVLMPDGALVTETTYMLVENNDLTGTCGADYNTGHSGVPITGDAGVTRFTLPVRSLAATNAEDPGMDHDLLVDLLVAEDGSIVTGGTIEVGIEVDLSETDSVRFMDHQVTLVEACDTGTESKFDISYIGNRLDIQAQEKPVMVPHSGANVYVNRYNDNPLLTTDADHRWFIRVIDVDSDCNSCTVVIGRRLVAGETFYVDGVRYDMPAIYVADNDEFKYITLQSPLPKCSDTSCANLDDFSHVSCQYLARLGPSDLVWVLPPFDDEHWMIDDIDLDKTYDAVDDCWYLDTEAGNIIHNHDGEGDREGALEFYYIDENTEERFDSSLAEIHARKDGVELWNWWSIFTKPCQYTELVLPDQETTSDQYKLWDGNKCNPGYDTPNADGNEYLVTTSFIAPNSEAEEREELCKSSDEVHDIIDRAATIANDDDFDSRDAYSGMPRMVFEFDAATDEDLFVNDDGVPTVRVYGEAGAIYPTHSLTDGDDFIYPKAVDPFDPGVIAKDSVTFNPAYIDDAYENGLSWWEDNIVVDGENGDEKVFLRIFYEPGYNHSADDKMSAYYSLYQVEMPMGALVTETTYMLLNDNQGSGHSGDPKAGGIAGTERTHFMLPVGSKNPADANPGMDRGDMVDLVYAEHGSIITAGTIEVEQTYDYLTQAVWPTDHVSFMDHTLQLTGFNSVDDPVFAIGYTGNMYAEHAEQRSHTVKKGEKWYFDRGNSKSATTNPAYSWYLEVTEVYSDHVDLKVGRRLVAGETFYVDGVRYDMPAIYVTDDDKFKYITFQSPIPKCDDALWSNNRPDYSHVSSQWLANILESEQNDMQHYVWVLPPFNEGHLMIDDIGIPKVSCGGDDRTIDSEAGNILGDVGSLKFYYIAEKAELRFDSSLAERHAYDGSDEIWNWWSIFTKPYQYTELVLPDQENTTAFPTADGNEYLITTSFIAPNCEEEEREELCKSDQEVHDIIDRASTLVLPETPDCPCDLNGDDYVNNDDVIELINNWGACPGCAADLNGDDYVNNDDVIELVNNWGAC